MTYAWSLWDKMKDATTNKKVLAVWWNIWRMM